MARKEEIEYIDDNYVVIWIGGRGETYPMYRYIIDDVEMLSNTDMYLKWHIEYYDGTEKSDTVYNILGKTELYGQAITIPEYLSLTPPSDELLASYENGSRGENITVKLNGTPVQFDTQPVIYNERTLVPVRYIGEAFGGTVDWNNDTKMVAIKVDSDEIKLFVNKNYILINGIAKNLDTPAQIIDGRTMIPLRAFAEAIGQSVEYYNGLIIIGSKNAVEDIIKTDLDKYISDNFAVVEKDSGQADSKTALESFLNNDFENTNITMQGDTYRKEDFDSNTEFLFRQFK